MTLRHRRWNLGVSQSRHLGIFQSCSEELILIHVPPLRAILRVVAPGDRLHGRPNRRSCRTSSGAGGCGIRANNSEKWILILFQFNKLVIRGLEKFGGKKLEAKIPGVKIPVEKFESENIVDWC